MCDWEADITEYLLWQGQIARRYVVRSAHDRTLLSGAGSSLRHTLEQAPLLGRQEIVIPQRGGRPGRGAHVSLRAQTVEIACPVRMGVKNRIRICELETQLADLFNFMVAPVAKCATEHRFSALTSAPIFDMIMRTDYGFRGVRRTWNADGYNLHQNEIRI